MLLDNIKVGLGAFGASMVFWHLNRVPTVSDCLEVAIIFIMVWTILDWLKTIRLYD